MTNLVFDMNNMLFRSMFVISNFKNSYSFDSKKETEELMRKISMDITFLIRLINPSRVIFAKDTKSWRKSINIEENEGYKGQRKQAPNINWDNIYSTLDEFLDIIQDNGMIVTKIESAEADDLIALWSDELLYNQKQHVIIVSGDEDIRQLVKSSTDNNNKKIFCTVFNPFMQGKNAARKLYVPVDFNEWLNKTEESDIWNMSATIDIDKDDFRRIKNTEKVRVEEIDGNIIAIRKIFCGDDGDNVPAIYTWISKTSSGEDKEVRITNSKFEKIYESLQNTPGEKLTYLDLVERKDKVLQQIKKIVKHEPTFKIEERLNRQIKLIILDKNVFPEKIVKQFNEIKKDDLIKPRPEIGGLNMNTLLQGTRFVKASAGGTGKGTEASIFNELDRLSNTKLF